MSDLNNVVVTVSEEVVQVVTVGIQGPQGAGYTSAPYIDFDKVLDPPSQEARMHWSPDTGTVSIGMPGGNVILQVGQEQLIQVRNKTGATILNGSLCYISGATGQLPEISKASASDYDQAMKTLAMATEDISHNSTGYVNTFGVVRDLNTNGILEGALVYLGETGNFTGTEPAYPLNKVTIGVCIYEHGVNGRIFFFPRLLSRKFGNPTADNFTGFDDLGRLISRGSARMWNDISPIPLLNQRTGGANVPTLAVFLGNIYQLTFAVNDYVFGNYELLHEYAEGTDLEPHVHMVTNTLDATDRAVKWELEYTVCNGDAAAPFTEAFPAPTVISSQVTIPANTPAKSHIIFTELPVIPGSSFRIGAYILWRLRRISSTGTAPSANPFALTLGFHVLNDTLGSDTIGQKTIS